MGELSRLISMVVALPGCICVMVGGMWHKDLCRSIMRPSLGDSSLWLSRRL